MSVNLPLEEVSATAYAAATPAGVGAENQTVIGVLINSGAAWAAAAMTAGVPEWRAAITGQASIADRFAATVRQYLDAAEVEDGFVDVAYANFGVYGEFAFVVVQLSDALVFMDPLTGNLLGPLEPGSALEAPPLLIEHPDAYEDGMGVRYYNEFRCRTTVGATWKNAPPNPGFVPIPPPAAAPPGTPAGRPSPWRCQDIAPTPATVVCRCEHDERWWLNPIPPGYPATLPTLIRVRVRCTAPGACTGTTPGPGVPLPTPPWNCMNRYWW